VRIVAEVVLAGTMTARMRGRWAKRFCADDAYVMLAG
jgi:hypothetical protein